MARRPGPLRVGRTLRDLYTPFGVELPLVACKYLCADQREARAEGSLVVREGLSA